MTDSNCINEQIELDYIRWKIYEEEYDGEEIICVDIWNKKTNKASGFRISINELNMLNISKSSFKRINVGYMRLFNRLCYNGDLE